MRQFLVIISIFAAGACGTDSGNPTAADGGSTDFVQTHTDQGPPPAGDSGVQPGTDGQVTVDTGTNPPPKASCLPTPLSVDRFSVSQRTTSEGRVFTGWGGTAQPTKAQKIPVVFVHGNGGTAEGWKPFRDHLCKQGYGDAEIWAITFQDYSCVGPCSSGSNTEHATELELFVKLVRDQTQAKRVSIVAVSMGVPTVRYYIKSLGGVARDEVALAYLVSGPNHGLADCDLPGAAAINVACAELDAAALSSGWLYKLNTPDETPNGQDDGLAPAKTVIYRTVRYTGDPFFPGDYVDSPILDGADNAKYSGSQHAAISLNDLTTYLGKATPAP